MHHRCSVGDVSYGDFAINSGRNQTCGKVLRHRKAAALRVAATSGGGVDRTRIETAKLLGKTEVKNKMGYMLY